MGTQERTPTAERLPTREQIAELTDLAWLEEALDTVSAAAKQIEVDLEFRSDDFATDDWEHRARRALTAHHICQGHLTRRIAFLRKKDRPIPQTNHDAKARKAEAHAKRLTAEAEARRVKLIADREKTVRAVTALAGRQSLLGHFLAVVKVNADRETFDKWMREAHDRQIATLLDDLPELPVNECTPQ